VLDVKIPNVEECDESTASQSLLDAEAYRPVPNVVMALWTFMWMKPEM
jgi:hypothetical protein